MTHFVPHPEGGSPLARLAAGLAVAGLLLGAAATARADAESDALEAVRKAGGSIQRDDKDPARPVLNIVFDGEGGPVRDALPHLTAFPKLQALGFSGASALDDEGTALLARLRGLRFLTIRGTKLTDEGLKGLAGLKDLEGLSLTRHHLTDAGLEHVAGLTKLRSLDLSATDVAGEGLSHLAGLKNLERLRLYNTRVDDSALSHLLALEGLKSLDLQRTRVTAAGLKRLKEAMPQLRVEADAPADGKGQVKEAVPEAAAAVTEKGLLLLGHWGARAAFAKVVDPIPALFDAADAARSRQLVTTGTLKAPEARGGPSRYDPAPADRLVWERPGQPAAEFFITDLRGDFEDRGSSFHSHTHRLAYRVAVKDQMDVAVERARDGGRYEVKLKGWMTLEGQRYSVDLIRRGEDYFENDSTGSEFRDDTSVDGTIERPGVRMTVAESSRADLVRYRREYVMCDRRVLNHTIVAGGKTYRWDDVVVRKNFKNGKISGADSDPTEWVCDGQVLVDGKRFATYVKDLEAFRKAETGYVLYKIQAPGGAIEVERWRLPDESPDIPL